MTKINCVGGLLVAVLLTHYFYLIFQTLPTVDEKQCIFTTWVQGQHDVAVHNDPPVKHRVLHHEAPNPTWNTHWIVLTSINSITPSVEKMLMYEKYSVLVVGDEKSPDTYDERVVYLTLDMQRKLNYRISYALPTNSYTRKNIGYLYAIAHGAQYIFDTDDDNAPDREPTVYSADMSQLAPCVAQPTVNPYAAFDRPDVWPRGLPLDVLHLEATARGSARNGSLRDGTDSWVQQGLADLDPDVDAVFRLTRSAELGRIVFLRRSPVYVPPGTMAPFNSQNTLFQSPAFWGLVLPASVPFRLTDIWRSFFVQRLMWMVGSHVSFIGPTVQQRRNTHSYFDDYMQERQMYEQSGALIRFLIAWRPTTDTIIADGLFGAMRDLAEDMWRGAYWAESDVELIEAWIADLVEIGYAAPPLVISAHDVATDREAVFQHAMAQAKMTPSVVNSPSTHCTPDNTNTERNARTLEHTNRWLDELLTDPAPVAILSANDGRGIGGQLYDFLWVATHVMAAGHAPLFSTHDRSLYDGTYCESGRGGFACLFDFPAVASALPAASITTIPHGNVSIAINAPIRNHIRDEIWGSAISYASILPTTMQRHGWSAFQWFAFVMHRMTEPRPALRALVDSKKMELGWNDRCIAVHIRRADKIIETRGHSYFDASLYVDEVERVLIEHPTLSHIFLTSDNASAIEQFEFLLERRHVRLTLVVDRTQTRYNGKECANFDENAKQKQCSTRGALRDHERDDWAARSLIDLYLLSSCEYIVGSIGSFYTRAAAGRLVGTPRYFVEPFPERRVRSIYFEESMEYFTQQDNNTIVIPSLENFY